MRSFRWAGASVSLALVVTLLSACTLFSAPTPIPKTAEIVGTWVHAEPNHPAVTLVMRADGTFSIDAIPRQVFASVGDADWDKPLDWGHPITMSGTWKVSDQRSGGNPYLDLVVDPHDSKPLFITKLGFSIKENKPFLYYYVGPIDNDVRFEFNLE